MENVTGLFTGQTDKNGNRIHYETTKLKLPDGRFAKLMFDYGQLSAYYASVENDACIVDLQGVNNHHSHYLRDCEIV